MVGGEVTLPVRLALLYYFDKHLRVDLAALDASSTADARRTPVVVSNVDEYEAALRSAGVERRIANRS
jgi:hypothetical protein